jgi:hypothetical protein
VRWPKRSVVERRRAFKTFWKGRKGTYGWILSIVGYVDSVDDVVVGSVFITIDAHPISRSIRPSYCVVIKPNHGLGENLQIKNVVHISPGDLTYSTCVPQKEKENIEWASRHSRRSDSRRTAHSMSIESHLYRRYSRSKFHGSRKNCIGCVQSRCRRRSG